ncbi:MAG TPA: nickel pincer cofactor biosynthesis protein LarC [Candidatus Hypogeohydataceae bacterium YC40]
MRIAYFDCFSGAGGDMILGSLVDAGLDHLSLVEEFKKIPLPPHELSFKRVQRGGISGIKFDLIYPLYPPKADKSYKAYAFRELQSMVSSSTLRDNTKEKALRVLTRLGEAEARIHNTSLEEVEFHELGAIDTILDIVGAVTALETLGIEKAFSSPLPTGSGLIDVEHGRLPLPAPATVELLKGRKIIAARTTQELTTPTGAAILTTLTEEVDVCPDLRLEKVGYGAGSRKNPECPNLLRVLIGELAPKAEEDEVWMVETNLDDMTGQLCGYVIDKLFKAGALDVYTTPIQMKKNRPGILLSALVTEAARPAVEMVFFQETTTFGIRAYKVARKKLHRMSAEVNTPYGKVKVKVGWLDGHGVLLRRIAPEYEDCRRIAEEKGVPLRLVYQSAMETELEVRN